MSSTSPTIDSSEPRRIFTDPAQYFLEPISRNDQLLLPPDDQESMMMVSAHSKVTEDCPSGKAGLLSSPREWINNRNGNLTFPAPQIYRVSTSDNQEISVRLDNSVRLDDTIRLDNSGLNSSSNIRPVSAIPEEESYLRNSPPSGDNSGDIYQIIDSRLSPPVLNTVSGEGSASNRMSLQNSETPADKFSRLPPTLDEKMYYHRQQQICRNIISNLNMDGGGYYVEANDQPQIIINHDKKQNVSQEPLHRVMRRKPFGQRLQKREGGGGGVGGGGNSQQKRFDNPAGEIWSCCCASEFNLRDLNSRCPLLVRNSFSEITLDLRIIAEYGETVIMASASGSQIQQKSYASVYINQSPIKCVFVFCYGCIVAWGLSRSERLDLVNSLKKYMKGPIMNYEEDDMAYTWSYSGPKPMRHDTVHLISSESFEWLAYSYALAQSVKLSVFEERVEGSIESSRYIPEHLAKTGSFLISRGEISKKIGELFTSRFYINLNSDILDTPDIFWDRDEYVDCYTACRNYLEIPKRVEILNQRLDIMKDLYDIINYELNYQKSNWLEWIIIILIMFEFLETLIWNILIKGILKWV